MFCSFPSQPDLENGGVDVAPAARVMLRLASLYVISDATQLIFSGTLRGAGDTKFVMWISVILHWIFAFIAWYSIRFTAVAPVFMWILFIGFVLSLGVGMGLRYRFGPWRTMSLLE